MPVNLSVLDEFGMPVGWGSRSDRYYQTLAQTGISFDDTSPFWDYDFVEIARDVKLLPGDSLQGIDANNFYRYHYLTPDELQWAQVKYTRDASGKWKPSSAVKFGVERSNDFGNFLKFAAPLFLMAIPGVGQAIGATAFGALGVTVSPTIAAAVGNIAVSTALSGGDIERAVINQLAAGAGAFAGGFVGQAVDSARIGQVVASVTTAAATGGDIRAALLSSGVNAMSDFNFSDFLAPASGSIKFDPSAFEGYDAGQVPDGWSLTTAQAIDNYAAMNVAPAFDESLMTQSYGYHDPVYTPEDSITPEDTNYGGNTTSFPIDFGTVNLPLPDFQEPAPPFIDVPNITIPPTTPANEGSDWLGSVVTGVTALAAAAMKLIPTIQALRNGDVIKSGSMTNTGGVVTANSNGTINTRNSTTGAVSTTIPPVGKAYQTPDGNIITNNGNGTYTVVKPDGSRYVGNYTATSTTGGGLNVGAGSGFFDKPQNVMIAGGLVLAVLLLKGK